MRVRIGCVGKPGKSRSLTAIRKKRDWVRDDRLMGMGGIECSPKAGGWVWDDTASGMGGVPRAGDRSTYLLGGCCARRVPAGVAKGEKQIPHRHPQKTRMGSG
jgi:hypothetical protein